MTMTDILLVFATIGLIIYFWFKFHLTYWKRKNVPNIPSIRHFVDIFAFRKCPAVAFDEIYYDEKTKNEPIVGVHVFHKPAIVIKDPELVKRVLIKEFPKFQDRFASSDPHTDKFGSNSLFFLGGAKWKLLRSNLTPVFTSGKIKQMFELVGKEMDKHVCALTNNSSKSITKEIKSISSLFTIDVIASIAYGINANSLSNPKADFLINGIEIFYFNTWRAWEFTTFFFLPSLVSLFKFKVFTAKSTKFLKSSFEYIMKEREKTKLIRNDLIDALLHIKNKQKDETDINKTIEDEVLLSQAANFFVAGYETSSTTMAFSLYELAKNIDIQNRLREEIKQMIKDNDGEINYEQVQNLEYLNMVVLETLRLYPILPFLDRVLNDSENKGFDLAPYNNYVLPNGTPVFIPIYSIQRDEKYFPEPEKFDPERFSVANKDKIVPYTYMPFGVGPRNCIGERIGLIQTKIGLIHFLKNHYVRPSLKAHQTLKLEKKALLLQLEGGIICDIIRDPLIV